MNSRQAAWILALVILAGAFLRGIDITERRYENGHRGACCAFFALMANNHMKHGLATTGGVGVLNPAWAPKEHFNYYLHHPPGSILIATIGANLTGANPFGLRLIFLPFSIGIVILVFRLARSRDPRVGAVAAGIAALTPIGVYYGAFVNFEIPTIFFLLLALHLFLRFERRGRKKDALRYLLAQAAAVGCDWIALGLPLVLLVLAPLRRRRSIAVEPPRGLGYARTAALGVVVGFAVAAIVELGYAFQVSRYGIDPDAGAGYYLEATPLAKTFTFTLWGERIGKFAVELFTWPVLGIAALGLLAALLRACRARLTQLDTAALALTSIAIANIVILGSHALKHDYYLLYAMPACALLAAIVLRRLFIDLTADPASPWPSRALMLSILVLLGFLGTRAHATIETRRNFAQATLGQEIAKHTVSDAVVFLASDATAQVTVQADRFVAVGTVVRSLPDYERARDLALRFGMAGRPHVLLLAPSQISLLAPEFRTWLDANCQRSESGPFVIYQLGLLTPRGE